MPDSGKVPTLDGEIEVVTSGDFRVAYQLWYAKEGRCLNTFFDAEEAEEKREELIDSWPEYTEASLVIVELFCDVS